MLVQDPQKHDKEESFINIITELSWTGFSWKPVSFQCRDSAGEQCEVVGSAGSGRLLPCDCSTWKRKQEDNRKLLSLTSAGGSLGRDLKALGADLNWVLYWGREKDGMEKCREAGQQGQEETVDSPSVIRL